MRLVASIALLAVAAALIDNPKVYFGVLLVAISIGVGIVGRDDE